MFNSSCRDCSGPIQHSCYCLFLSRYCPKCGCLFLVLDYKCPSISHVVGYSLAVTYSCEKMKDYQSYCGRRHKNLWPSAGSYIITSPVVPYVSQCRRSLCLIDVASPSAWFDAANLVRGVLTGCCLPSSRFCGYFQTGQTDSISSDVFTSSDRWGWFRASRTNVCAVQRGGRESMQTVCTRMRGTTHTCLRHTPVGWHGSLWEHHTGRLSGVTVSVAGQWSSRRGN